MSLNLSNHELPLKKFIGIVIIFMLLTSSQFLPPPTGLSSAGLTAIFVFLSAITAWITEILPMSISALFLIFLMPKLGVMDMNSCYELFGGSAFFFVMAVFALSIAVGTTTIPLRLCKGIITWAGTSSRKLMFGITYLTGLLSGFMSDLAQAAMFISLIKPLLKANKAVPGKSNLGKCLYIGIPIATNAGFMTLAGTPGNMVIVSLISEHSGEEITFLGFILLAAPISLLVLLIHWFCLTRLFKPEPITQEAIDFYNKSKDEKSPITVREKKCLVVFVSMVVLWISGTWIPIFDTATVAVLGMITLIMPGMNVITWEQYYKNAGWDVIFLCGTIPVLVGGMSMNGSIDWIVDLLFSRLTGFPPLVITLIVAFVLMVFRNFIPTGIAFIAFFSMPIIGLTEVCDLNFVGMMILLGFWSVQILLLPYDPIYMIGYGDKFFKATDLLYYGSRVSILIVIVTALVIPAVAVLCGY